MGPVPPPVGYAILANSARFLRGYIWGSTLIGVFNGAVVAAGALVIGVPLAFTIFVVQWLTNYIPMFGAFIGGAFAVLIALGTGGVKDAIWMLDLRAHRQRAAADGGLAVRAGRVAQAERARGPVRDHRRGDPGRRHRRHLRGAVRQDRRGHLPPAQAGRPLRRRAAGGTREAPAAGGRTRRRASAEPAAEARAGRDAAASDA